MAGKSLSPARTSRTARRTWLRRAERLVGHVILIHAGKALDLGGFDKLDDFGLDYPDDLPRAALSGRRVRVGHAPPSVALGGARTVADRAHRRAAPAVPPRPRTVGVLPCRMLKKDWICAGRRDDAPNRNGAGSSAALHGALAA
jgi:hypothetical protein